MSIAATGAPPGVRSLAVAVTMFTLLFAVSLGSVWLNLADLRQRRRDLADAQQVLVQLQARRGPAGNTGAARVGSPFLEGPTVTVAGASLLQRVAGAIAQAGGTMQSSQVDIGGQGRDGAVGLLVNGEIDQLALQKLLYDLEGGMPFLTVDQLDIQTPATAANEAPVASGRLKIMIGISGRWLQKQ